MTISELISRLETIKAERGDLPIWVETERGPWRLRFVVVEPAFAFIGILGGEEQVPERVELG